MKWGELSKLMWHGHQDATEACELRPSERHGEDKANATELDQWTIDRMYDLLGTALVNIKAAMNKLRPHTTYHKGKQPE